MRISECLVYYYYYHQQKQHHLLNQEHHIVAVWNYSWHQHFVRNFNISQLNLLIATDFSDVWCVWQSDSFMCYKTAFRDSFVPCCLDKLLTDINYEFSLGYYVELRNCWAVMCKPDPRNPHVLLRLCGLIIQISWIWKYIRLLQNSLRNKQKSGLLKLLPSLSLWSI